MRIFLSRPNMSGHEKTWGAEAFASNFIAPLGPQLDEFELVVEDYHLNNSPVLIHSSTIPSPTVKMGPVALSVAGSIVNADTSIRRGTILNTAFSVDHDGLIGDFVYIYPIAHLASGVGVSDGTWIGIGEIVRERGRIGKNVIVAAGAAVVSYIEDCVCLAGVPACEF